MELDDKMFNFLKTEKNLERFSKLLFYAAVLGGFILLIGALSSSFKTLFG